MNIKYPDCRAVTILLLLLACSHAFATLPASLNYQGHLTDTVGAPVDGAVSMTFRIYNVETSGSVLWSNAMPVTVQQGVFSVELGGTVNPFPLGLFEQPLWIGLEVGSDGEMSPRRPITTTGFAFKADDANTLDGISVSTLDQSAHVTDMANPHNVTAAQAGAADAAALTAHTGNTSNPHSVTAAQTGAASSANFIAHASDISAHHTRYNNAEAVAAMGVKKDSNALHHDRYSNASAVAAMLAADGAGSTLDADKVDGLQASEIIDAAQDEVRTPISSLPFSINQTGSYYLAGNLDGSSGGIDITVDNVTLDLMGFTIDGGGTVADYGIDFNQRSNVTIRNGTVSGFGYGGVRQENTTGRYAIVMDVQVLGNGTLGGSGSYSGIVIYGGNSHVERCTAGNNGGYGIYAGTSSKLINNTAYNNSSGIYGSEGSTLSGNTAYSNTGSGIYGSNGAILNNNTAYDNNGYGISSGYSANLSDNTAFGNNGLYGIHADVGAIVKGNTAFNNSGIGIYANFGANVIGNSAYLNVHWGIYGQGANLIKDNTLYANNFSDTTGEGGLYVYNNSRVVGNTLDSNQQNNIYINSTGNTIEENHFNNSTNGLNFVTNQNFFANNRGHGNTNNYVNSSSNTNGGGNVEF